MTSKEQDSQEGLRKRGLNLEYMTLGWNVVGALVLLAAAYLAHSIALLGFGIDSMLEISASTVVIWQLSGVPKERERQALTLIGWAFLALAVYIAYLSMRSLMLHVLPGSSFLGAVWLALTVVAMLGLAWGKHQTGRALNNPVLSTEARVTLIDAALAAATLLGIMLNGLFGLWWADPLAGLVIVYYGLREGLHALATAKKG